MKCYNLLKYQGEGVIPIKKISFLLLTVVVLFSGWFQEAPASAADVKYKDVTVSHPYKKPIDVLTSKGIISGYKDKTFRPNNRITRQAAAMAVAKALKLSTKNRPDPHFSDVKKSASVYPYIAALVDEGIWPGAKKFNPTGPLTRSEAAHILVKANSLVHSYTIPLKDVSKKNAYYSDIQSFIISGVGSPRSSEVFGLKDLLKRGQFADFLYNAYSYTEKREAFETKVLTIVNSERKKAGRHALKKNKDLTKTARLKSDDMLSLHYFSHTSPTYGSPFEMMMQFHIDYSLAGENIALGYSTPADVMEGWMNSPGHKANILNSGFTQIGIGYSNDTNRPYWTQQFIGE